MLSAIWEASQAEPMLQPVRISDADYARLRRFRVLTPAEEREYTTTFQHVTAS